jgi:hypothetical protein
MIFGPDNKAEPAAEHQPHGSCYFNIIPRMPDKMLYGKSAAGVRRSTPAGCTFGT